MRRIRSSFNYVPEPSDFEAPYGESCTEPDASYTITEIIRKFANGIDPGVDRTPVYLDAAGFDDHDLEKVKNLDPYDKAVLASEVAEQMKADKAVIDAHNKAAREAAEKEAEETRLMKAEFKARREKDAAAAEKPQQAT